MNTRYLSLMYVLFFSATSLLQADPLCVVHTASGGIVQIPRLLVDRCVPSLMEHHAEEPVDVFRSALAAAELIEQTKRVERDEGLEPSTLFTGRGTYAAFVENRILQQLLSTGAVPLGSVTLSLSVRESAIFIDIITGAEVAESDSTPVASEKVTARARACGLGSNRPQRERVCRALHECGFAPWVITAIEQVGVLPGGAVGEAPALPAVVPAPPVPAGAAQGVAPAVARALGLPDELTVVDGVLNLSGRIISEDGSLGDALAQLANDQRLRGQEIKVLNLQNTGATHLPAGVFAHQTFASLKVLKLSGNRGLRIDAGSFKGLKNLLVLSLSECDGLAMDDEALQETPFLEVLRIGACGLDHLPTTSCCPNLRILDASYNGINDAHFTGNTKLEVLDLQHNSLESIPASLIPGRAGRTSLRYLLLRHNEIVGIDLLRVERLAQQALIDLFGNPLANDPIQVDGLRAFFKDKGYQLEELRITKDISQASAVRTAVHRDMQNKVIARCTDTGTIAHPHALKEFVLSKRGLRIDDLIEVDPARKQGWLYRHYPVVLGCGIIAGAAVGAAVGGGIGCFIIHIKGAAACKAGLEGILAVCVGAVGAIVGGIVGHKAHGKSYVEHGNVCLGSSTYESGNGTTRTRYEVRPGVKKEIVSVARMAALLSIFKQYLAAFHTYLNWLYNREEYEGDSEAFDRLVADFRKDLHIADDGSLVLSKGLVTFSQTLAQLLADNPLKELRGKRTEEFLMGDLFSGDRLAELSPDVCTEIAALLPEMSWLQVSKLAAILTLFGRVAAIMHNALMNQFYGVSRPVALFQLDTGREQLLEALSLINSDLLMPVWEGLQKLNAGLPALDAIDNPRALSKWEAEVYHWYDLARRLGRRRAFFTVENGWVRDVSPPAEDLGGEFA